MLPIFDRASGHKLIVLTPLLFVLMLGAFTPPPTDPPTDASQAAGTR